TRSMPQTPPDGSLPVADDEVATLYRITYEGDGGRDVPPATYSSSCAVEQMGAPLCSGSARSQFAHRRRDCRLETFALAVLLEVAREFFCVRDNRAAFWQIAKISEDGQDTYVGVGKTIACKVFSIRYGLVENIDARANVGQYPFNGLAIWLTVGRFREKIRSKIRDHRGKNRCLGDGHPLFNFAAGHGIVGE